MKRWLIIIQVAFLFLLVTGCRIESKIDVETLAMEPEIFHYEGTEQVSGIAIDENGLLYTSSSGETKEIQKFSIYDWDGTCLQQVELTLGNGIVKDIIVEDGTLYCIIPKMAEQVLVAIDLTTWAVTELAVISEEDYLTISKIVAIGDYFYLFGKSPMGDDISYSLLPEVSHVNYSGEMIGRISRVEENPSVEFFDVEVALNIFKTKEETLMIYYYNEEQGFGFLEYLPQERVVKEVGNFSTSAVEGFGSCEEGYLFFKDFKLFYGTLDGVEAQITTDSSWIGDEVEYFNGFAFYYDYEEDMVERVCVTDTLRENKTIRLLVNMVDSIQLYNCGYQIIKQEVDMETFSLKALAGDSDFDLYLLNSRYPNAYNIKKNGAFYALNDVPGVQEYLDACFPNLKEVAINEEGDIWMLPIRLDVPLLLYDKVYCEAQGIDFSKMNYKEFIAFTEQAEREQDGKIMNAKIMNEFFVQYFHVEDSFDTELFRSYAIQFKSLYEEIKEEIYTILPNFDSTEFFYDYIPFQHFLLSHYEDYIKKVEQVEVMEVPKITEGIPNLGTVTFFAVNPQSENLEATLVYLSTLCRYLMTLENSFLLADTTTYLDTPFVQECYDLYKTGEIYFAMEEAVYFNTFCEYLEGTLTLEEMIQEIERKLEMYLKE